MSRLAVRLYELALFAYPKAFRRRYGAEMVLALRDQHDHDDREVWTTLLHELADVALTAPRSRWETPMNRVVLITATLTVAVGSAIALGPYALLPLAVVALAAVLFWAGKRREIQAIDQSRGVAVPVVAGIMLIMVAVAIPIIDGGELNQLWWSIMTLSFLSGTAAIVAGLVRAGGQRVRRHPSRNLAA